MFTLFITLPVALQVCRDDDDDDDDDDDVYLALRVGLRFYSK